MNPKTLVVALIVAATLSVPARTAAARTAETSQLLLPAVGLVAGLIGGKIVGAKMGIAAFGTAISGKVPGAIIAGLMSAALAAHLAPPTMSLTDVILIGVAVTRLAIQVGSTRWEDLVENVTELARRFGGLLRWAAEAARSVFGPTDLEAAERRDWFSAPELEAGRIPGNPRTTVVEFREVANPGGLVPDLTPVAETWKGQPVR